MDCIEGMKLIPDNSIDSIVTDPPYELGFMDKQWDSTGIAYNIDVWKECLRVLKPGGHLLSFGGSRTYHRMACAIEDAGFEIRDQIMWVYGSGFAKGTNISKQIDKLLGAERTEGKREWRGGKRTGGIANSPETNLGTQTLIKYDEPASEEGKKWKNWNSQLKPAHEPIVLARKPLSEKTLAENVLKWGTGGINIDECRIETSDKLSFGSREIGDGIKYNKCIPTTDGIQNPNGRFPANIIFDEEAGKMLDEQSGVSKSKQITGNRSGKQKEIYGDYVGQENVVMGHNDSGGASRFFYCAKTSKKERGEFNNHATVKPLKLMEYLITLVTPPNGIVLDPFTGSGTTPLCAKELGFNYVGLDSDGSYCEIARKRISEV